MKTILKMYENGNFEVIGTPLIENGVSYKFSENTIVVPKIIEYPPPGTRNYFIEKTSVSGWLEYDDGLLVEANEDDRASDYIDVTGWGSVTIRVRFSGIPSDERAWANVCFYTSSKTFIRTPFDDFVGKVGESIIWEIKLPVNVGFIRISANYYDTPGISVKASVEKGNTTNPKHYLAPEDLPSWVKDAGNPISFFKEGIVIKGSIVQTNN